MQVQKRYQCLKAAYEELRQILPKFPYEKLTRMDTVRLAIIYMSFMTDLLVGKDENDIEVRSLKYGWTSVREKLQQQMAQQPRAAAAETAVAQQVVFTQQMSAVGVTFTATADYSTLMTPPLHPMHTATCHCQCLLSMLCQQTKRKKLTNKQNINKQKLSSSFISCFVFHKHHSITSRALRCVFFTL